MLIYRCIIITTGTSCKLIWRVAYYGVKFHVFEVFECLSFVDLFDEFGLFVGNAVDEFVGYI